MTEEEFFGKPTRAPGKLPSLDDPRVEGLEAKPLGEFTVRHADLCSVLFARNGPVAVFDGRCLFVSRVFRGKGIGYPLIEAFMRHEPRVKDVLAEPFVQGMGIRRGRGVSIVYDNDRPVAQYGPPTHGMWVLSDYRRRGIMTELVYDFRTKNPRVPPVTKRNVLGMSIQRKVWRRICREGLNNELPAPVSVVE